MTTDELERTFVCCVVFLDIVGFSKQPVSQQITWKRELNEIIGKAVKSVAVEDRVLLDTGDGASLCFLGDPEMALTAALGMVEDFGTRGREMNPPLLVRIGINMGSVRVITDFNGQRNIVGDGINVGQRIMSFARENQILTSRTFCEIISCLTPAYEDLFIPRGKHADKHGREHEVFEVRTLCDLLEAPPAGAPVLKPLSSGIILNRGLEKKKQEYPPEAIQALKALLTSALGPIASVLVTRACKTEQSLELLCETLASQIPSGEQRSRFVDGVQKILNQHTSQNKTPAAPKGEGTPAAKPACIFEAAYLAQLEKMLVEFVGPISKVLVKRDSAAATSKEELIAKLASHIDNGQQKRKFEERATKAN